MFEPRRGEGGSRRSEGWLLSVREIAPWAAWHARLMVVAWIVILPLGVLIARFFKVLPRQPWPETLDSKNWWHLHRALQYSGIAIMTVAALLAASNADLGHSAFPLHGLLGWFVVALGWLQVVGGLLRGSKGGPQAGTDGRWHMIMRGDHYDMTRRRVIFEYVHKAAGYLAVVLAPLVVALGLHAVAAPSWMGWWIAAAWIGGLSIFAWLQRSGRCIDTYQAIWGPSRDHPGNRRSPIGWGIRRFEDQTRSGANDSRGAQESSSTGD